MRRYSAEAEAEAYVLLIREESLVVDDPASTAPVGSDPDHEYLIALARARRVDALVSGDPDLLALRERIPVRAPRELLDVIQE